MPILVASSFRDVPGTLIHGGSDMVEQFNKVRGIAHDLDVAKITVRGVPDRPGIAAAIFEPLAEAQHQRGHHRPERQRGEDHRPHLHRLPQRPASRRMPRGRADRPSRSAPATCVATTSWAR